MNDLVLVLAVVVPTVIGSLWWVLRSRDDNPALTADELPMILVRHGIVDHASDSVLERLPIVIGAHSWGDLREILLPEFPGIPTDMLPDSNDDTVVTVRHDTSAEYSGIRVVWQADGALLTFLPAEAEQSAVQNTDELDLLHQLSVTLPHPAWKTDKAGKVVWNNAAYSALAKRLPEGSKDTCEPVFDLSGGADGENAGRVQIDIPDTAYPEWYDVTRHPLGQGTLYHATSLTALIKAEEAQRDFVQTLAKTFAHLSIGLAIFNRDRQLALFNPALVDLTGLSVSFLSPRPTLDSFFDAMRENRRMPEPKNYKTWRQRMADLVSAAEVGQFEETWTLETGQTYSVKGRPHPDGAIAFLIDDISAEISLTRNFRAELELGQSLADTFEDAVAVFSQSGTLTFSNKAYDLLWGFQFDTSFADVTIGDAICMWKEKSTPNPLWQDLHDSVMSLEDRGVWEMPVCIKGKLPMQCKIVPIASGATVVRFSRQPVPAPSGLPVPSERT
ncbi:PAS-domain containing protein [Sulfitobacter sp. F26169L]|uniref:PAS-domain containing protein n=1 Tax=Sulfitobacter sp. F26169L TaxID=2996015 RepID=UPI002260F369|nr:PAS-domain containing protein [Sulfitobacter sp. F26169L]MCX7565870.1 PAS-domain containing protein [Sulfitobacter sp. F26169L]